MEKITVDNITWIDIAQPDENKLEELKEKYNLHPVIANQFIPSIKRPKIEEHGDQIFIVLHFPVYNKKTKQIKPVELDFILVQDTLITSHSESIPYLDTFFSDCELQDYHKDRCFKSPGHLIFSVLDWLIDSCLPMLDHIEEKIDVIENNVFEGREKEMLTEIALVKRDLIDFRRAIKPQRSVLDILEKKSKRIFSPAVRPMAQEVIGSVIRVWNVLENHNELINSIEQTNNSLLSYKLSDIMKFLTAVSFITFPLSIIVGFFGMNIFGGWTIIQEGRLTWLAILSFMILVTATMIIFFKKKKWL